MLFSSAHCPSEGSSADKSRRPCGFAPLRRPRFLGRLCRIRPRHLALSALLLLIVLQGLAAADREDESDAQASRTSAPVDADAFSDDAETEAKAGKRGGAPAKARSQKGVDAASTVAEVSASSIPLKDLPPPVELEEEEKRLKKEFEEDKRLAAAGELSNPDSEEEDRKEDTGKGKDRAEAAASPNDGSASTELSSVSELRPSHAQQNQGSLDSKKELEASASSIPLDDLPPPVQEIEKEIREEKADAAPTAAASSDAEPDEKDRIKQKAAADESASVSAEMEGKRSDGPEASLGEGRTDESAEAENDAKEIMRQTRARGTAKESASSIPLKDLPPPVELEEEEKRLKNNFEEDKRLAAAGELSNPDSEEEDRKEDTGKGKDRAEASASSSQEVGGGTTSSSEAPELKLDNGQMVSMKELPPPVQEEEEEKILDAQPAAGKPSDAAGSKRAGAPASNDDDSTSSSDDPKVQQESGQNAPVQMEDEEDKDLDAQPAAGKSSKPQDAPQSKGPNDISSSSWNSENDGDNMQNQGEKDKLKERKVTSATPKAKRASSSTASASSSEDVPHSTTSSDVPVQSFSASANAAEEENEARQREQHLQAALKKVDHQIDDITERLSASAEGAKAVKTLSLDSTENDAKSNTPVTVTVDSSPGSDGREANGGSKGTSSLEEEGSSKKLHGAKSFSYSDSASAEARDAGSSVSFSADSKSADNVERVKRRIEKLHEKEEAAGDASASSASGDKDEQASLRKLQEVTRRLKEEHDLLEARGKNIDQADSLSFSASASSSWEEGGKAEKEHGARNGASVSQSFGASSSHEGEKKHGRHRAAVTQSFGVSSSEEGGNSEKQHGKNRAEVAQSFSASSSSWAEEEHAEHRKSEEGKENEEGASASKPWEEKSLATRIAENAKKLSPKHASGKSSEQPAATRSADLSKSFEDGQEDSENLAARIQDEVKSFEDKQETNSKDSVNSLAVRIKALIKTFKDKKEDGAAEEHSDKALSERIKDEIQSFEDGQDKNSEDNAENSLATRIKDEIESFEANEEKSAEKPGATRSLDKSSKEDDIESFEGKEDIASEKPAATRSLDKNSKDDIESFEAKEKGSEKPMKTRSLDEDQEASFTQVEPKDDPDDADGGEEAPEPAAEPGAEAESPPKDAEASTLSDSVYDVRPGACTDAMGGAESDKGQTKQDKLTTAVACRDDCRKHTECKGWQFKDSTSECTHFIGATIVDVDKTFAKDYVCGIPKAEEMLRMLSDGYFAVERGACTDTVGGAQTDKGESKIKGLDSARECRDRCQETLGCGGWQWCEKRKSCNIYVGVKIVDASSSFKENYICGVPKAASARMLSKDEADAIQTEITNGLPKDVPDLSTKDFDVRQGGCTDTVGGTETDHGETKKPGITTKQACRDGCKAAENCGGWEFTSGNDVPCDWFLGTKIVYVDKALAENRICGIPRYQEAYFMLSGSGYTVERGACAGKDGEQLDKGEKLQKNIKDPWTCREMCKKTTKCGGWQWCQARMQCKFYEKGIVPGADAKYEANYICGIPSLSEDDKELESGDKFYVRRGACTDTPGGPPTKTGRKEVSDVTKNKDCEKACLDGKDCEAFQWTRGDDNKCYIFNDVIIKDVDKSVPNTVCGNTVSEGLDENIGGSDFTMKKGACSETIGGSETDKGQEKHPEITTAAGCRDACKKDKGCKGWQWTDAKRACKLFKGVTILDADPKYARNYWCGIPAPTPPPTPAPTAAPTAAAPVDDGPDRGGGADEPEPPPPEEPPAEPEPSPEPPPEREPEPGTLPPAPAPEPEPAAPATPSPTAAPATPVPTSKGGCLQLNVPEVDRDYSTIKGKQQKGEANGQSMLDSENAWAPDTSDDSQYLTMDMKAEHSVCGVVVQGSPGEACWVTEFTVEISKDGTNYESVPGTFTGDTNQNDQVQVSFDQKISCTAVKIIPKSWENCIGLRAAVMVEEIMPVPEKKEDDGKAQIPAIPATTTTTTTEPCHRDSVHFWATMSKRRADFHRYGTPALLSFAAAFVEPAAVLKLTFPPGYVPVDRNSGLEADASSLSCSVLLPKQNDDGFGDPGDGATIDANPGPDNAAKPDDAGQAAAPDGGGDLIGDGGEEAAALLEKARRSADPDDGDGGEAVDAGADGPPPESAGSATGGPTPAGTGLPTPAPGPGAGGYNGLNKAEDSDDGDADINSTSDAWIFELVREAERNRKTPGIKDLDFVDLPPRPLKRAASSCVVGFGKDVGGNEASSKLVYNAEQQPLYRRSSKQEGVSITFALQSNMPGISSDPVTEEGTRVYWFWQIRAWLPLASPLPETNFFTLEWSKQSAEPKWSGKAVFDMWQILGDWDCKYADWIGWGTCSAACGGGMQRQIRRILSAPPQGGSGIPCPETRVRDVRCNEHECNDACQFDEKAEVIETVSDCTAKCGGGVQTVRRSWKFGSNCPKFQDDLALELRACNTHKCKPGCHLASKWTVVSECSAACGKGMFWIYRAVMTKDPEDRTCKAEYRAVPCMLRSCEKFLVYPVFAYMLPRVNEETSVEISFTPPYTVKKMRITPPSGYAILTQAASHRCNAPFHTVVGEGLTFVCFVNNGVVDITTGTRPLSINVNYKIQLQVRNSACHTNTWYDDILHTTIRCIIKRDNNMWELAYAEDPFVPREDVVSVFGYQLFAQPLVADALHRDSERLLGQKLGWIGTLWNDASHRRPQFCSQAMPCRGKGLLCDYGAGRCVMALPP
eukprot:TRINITY_DN1808_c0_g1_i1.p1 TRINITY_DN1808_c0_g1~~TRINITY_DN1808_c0_g1_i1.p1  ORF type:complete len:2728 (-),score=649.36 TRINITY_DN1808_c0_g1_i1:100-8283(-)